MLSRRSGESEITDILPSKTTSSIAAKTVGPDRILDVSGPFNPVNWRGETETATTRSSASVGKDAGNGTRTVFGFTVEATVLTRVQESEPGIFASTEKSLAPAVVKKVISRESVLAVNGIAVRRAESEL